MVFYFMTQLNIYFNRQTSF